MSVDLFRCMQTRNKILGFYLEKVFYEDVTKACWHCSSLDPGAFLGLGQFVGIRGTVTVLSVGVGMLRHQAQQ